MWRDKFGGVVNLEWREGCYTRGRASLFEFFEFFKD